MKLAADVLDLYEADYIATWDGVLQDLEPVPFSESADAMTTLAILSAPTSPLRGLLQTVDDNTFLVKPPDAAAPVPGAMAAAQQTLGKLFAQGKAAAGVPTTTPGTRTTAHFNQIHQLMAGNRARADRPHPRTVAADSAGAALDRHRRRGRRGRSTRWPTSS